MTYISPNEAALGVILAITEDRLIDFFAEQLMEMVAANCSKEMIDRTFAERQRLIDIRRARKESNLIVYHETLATERKNREAITKGAS